MNTIREFLARRRHKGDAGYTTETIVVIALLVGIAIAAVTAVGTTIQNKATSISLDAGE
ncbi:hypothetical protein [Nocardiopsis ansamitocini]|uniref:Uncharacterized protein n=1 Tax=Nocardiopsis ansamitocini TaxID=1670832 RepID=A0A9W6P507_9ACTN|nr:hypothetical protein [Nocardiopsis ansamitocini]GLU47474.1 hypothetical protein Nans01_18250 [Nocardiopsis ansamitocini]